LLPTALEVFSLVTLRNFNQLFTDYKSVGYKSQSNEEGYDASDPNVTENHGCISRHVAVETQPLHKDVEKYGYGNADAARDHAGLDLVIAFHLRRNAARTLNRSLPSLLFLRSEKHLGHPRITPTELVFRSNFERLSNRLQVAPHTCRTSLHRLGESHLGQVITQLLAQLLIFRLMRFKSFLHSPPVETNQPQQIRHRDVMCLMVGIYRTALSYRPWNRKGLGFDNHDRHF
jgi:hypothetical protein